MTTPPAPRTPSAARCEGARPDDAPAAGTAPDAQGTVAVLLPDGWTLIELQDDDARLRTVDALVHRRLGKVPELAPLRASVLAELLDRTLTAARAGGVLMALADGELAVPASLTVYRVAGSLDARGRAAMVRILTTDEPGHALDIGEGAAGVVLRRAPRRSDHRDHRRQGRPYAARGLLDRADPRRPARLPGVLEPARRAA